jgi:hypothetical protein
MDLLGWWYSRGWAWIFERQIVARSKRLLEFFSIPDLLRTLFAPFRQDAFQTKGAPIGVKFQILGGNIISRFLGFFIRLALIASGLVALAVNFLSGIVIVLTWPLLPAAPILAAILLITKVGA